MDGLVLDYLISTWYSTFMACHSINTEMQGVGVKAKKYVRIGFNCWPSEGPYIDQDHCVIQMFNIIESEILKSNGR